MWFGKDNVRVVRYMSRQLGVVEVCQSGLVEVTSQWFNAGCVRLSWQRVRQGSLAEVTSEWFGKDYVRVVW